MPQQDGKKQRDCCIDYLRTIGIFLIILAHTKVPDPIRMIRMFDVVLLVFASGMSFSYSREIKSFNEYCLYIWKRVKRLLFPAWIFIIAYIIWLSILNLEGAQYNLSVDTIFKSFILASGVGYVWIIGVYLCMAVVAPFLKKNVGEN